MCGITGLWRKNGRDPADGARLERMADSIAHRGPDDFGYLLADSSSGRTQIGKRLAADFTPDLLLAARRLAITDLTPAGAQPIANEDNSVFVVFNGAIHNFVELRAELTARGHRFRSRTDTEVIVHAYEEWGADCARRFNGMWAYVIWDSRERRLVCSRDRFGIKPLYIAHAGGTFYFASEIKAMLASGEIAVHPHLPFLRGSFSRTPPVEGVETAFVGIEAVPAGYNLVVGPDGIARTRYWSYKDQSERYDYARPEETFRELLSDSVRIRLRADVPVALLLSGGFDSTAIAGEVARHQPKSGRAFTATFPGFAKDESAYARAAAEHYGLRLNTVEYDPSRLFGDLAALAWHLEAPPGRAQMLPRWQLLEAIARDVPVVLEGQGGDELYGGYDPHFRAAKRSEKKRAPAGGFLASLLVAASFIAMRKNARRERPGRAGGNRPDLVSRAVPNGSISKAHLPDLHFADDLNNTLAHDHAYGTLPFLLHMGDAISMAHSVEARLPYLDHRLVEFLFRLPADQKIRGGQPKYILRKSLAPELPPAILRRTDKIGFATPLGDWLAPYLENTIKPLLQSPAARSRGIFDERELGRFLDTYRPTRRASLLLYRALAVETWFQVFVDGKRPARQPAIRHRLLPAHQD